MRLTTLVRNPIKVWARLSYQLDQIRQPKPRLSRWVHQPNLAQSYEILEKILTENILPFWYPQVIDLEDGGYRLNHDLQGNWKGKTEKQFVNQARTLWFFSRLVNTKYGTNEHLEAARHGYNFLRNSLWDKQFGGFYWEVDSSGKVATKPDKHLYVQAFGIFALSEYAIASGDDSAIALARELFNLLDAHAHDPEYGGYLEFFHQDWHLPSESTNDYRNNTSPTIKTLDTHLHLMEALTPYYHLTKDSSARERLLELILIQSNTVIRKTVGAGTNKYQQNWTPLSGPNNERVNYGHDLENVWLLIEACKAAGILIAPLMDLFRTLFNYTLRYGFDKKNGGFYLFGYTNTLAYHREKIWWVQAEALVSALQMYCLTGEEIYSNCFSQTLDWIAKCQVDWEHGDWHATVGKNGKPAGDKAGALSGSWKSPYHNGRAVLNCLELLSSLDEDL